jgi:hypothetical protein
LYLIQITLPSLTHIRTAIKNFFEHYVFALTLSAVLDPVYKNGHKHRYPTKILPKEDVLCKPHEIFHQQYFLDESLMNLLTFIQVKIVIVTCQMFLILQYRYCKITYFRWDFISCFSHMVSLQQYIYGRVVIENPFSFNIFLFTGFIFMIIQLCNTLDLVKIKPMRK